MNLNGELKGENIISVAEHRTLLKEKWK